MSYSEHNREQSRVPQHITRCFRREMQRAIDEKASVVLLESILILGNAQLEWNTKERSVTSCRSIRFLDCINTLPLQCQTCLLFNALKVEFPALINGSFFDPQIRHLPKLKYDICRLSHKAFLGCEENKQNSFWSVLGCIDDFIYFANCSEFRPTKSTHQ